MTDIRVEMAVSVANVASWSTEGEHDSIDVMENPMGLYRGLMAFKASLSLLILVKIVSGVAAAPGVELDVETELDDDNPTIEIRNPVSAYSFSIN